MKFCIIPQLQVQRANALATPAFISPATPFAATMMGHALGRKLGVQPLAVGIIHYDAQMLAEEFYGQVAPQQFRGSTFIDAKDYSSKNKHALSLQPTASMHLSLSLVLIFEEYCPSASEITEQLKGCRLAGGLIVGHEAVQIVNSFAASSESVLSNLRYGFWLQDQSSLLTEQGKGRAEAMFDLVDYQRQASPLPQAKSMEAQDTERKAKEKSSLWLLPAVMGYATITPFAERVGVREDAPHAYAEPLVGLVHYKSVRQVQENDALFWSGSWVRDDVFVVTTNTLSHFV